MECVQGQGPNILKAIGGAVGTTLPAGTRAEPRPILGRTDHQQRPDGRNDARRLQGDGDRLEGSIHHLRLATDVFSSPSRNGWAEGYAWRCTGNREDRP